MQTLTGDLDSKSFSALLTSTRSYLFILREGKVNREKYFTVVAFLKKYFTSASDRIASKYKAQCPIVCVSIFDNKKC